MMLGYAFIISIIIVSMLLCIRLAHTIAYQLHAIWNRDSYPRLTRDKANSCRLHSWADIYLVMEEIEPATYKVCTDCGSVFGTKYRLNKAGLGSYKEKLLYRQKVKDLQDRAMRVRQAKLDMAMNALIRRELIKSPLEAEFLQNFFRKSVIEIDSINHEISEVLNGDTREPESN